MFKRMLKLPLSGQSSIFLFGPRGTGKTSWIKDHLNASLYFDLLDFSIYNRLLANPSRLENLIPPKYKDWIVLDEIQRVPELLNEVHRLIEHKKYKFLLTGSSARALRKHGVNLLAGRALTYNMHPLVIQEIGSENFNLEHILHYGLLPQAVTLENPDKYLKSYMQTYLRQEVMQEGLTRNIGAFTNFLEIASFSQGEVLNVSEIAREVGVNRQVIAGYFDILEDLLIGIRLSPFTIRAKRKVLAHQKFYYFDAGVFRAIRPMGPLDSQAEADGPTLETLFLQSLRAINDYFELDYRIYYWRTQTGLEVDFIAYGPKGLHAFEIKRSATITPKSLKGLRAFKEEYPEAQVHILFNGKHKEYYGDIAAIPFVQALEELPKLLS